MSDMKWLRFIRKLKPYNIQKGLRYLKHYGPKEFLIRLSERMEPEEAHLRKDRSLRPLRQNGYRPSLGAYRHGRSAEKSIIANVLQKGAGEVDSRPPLRL